MGGSSVVQEYATSGRRGVGANPVRAGGGVDQVERCAPTGVGTRDHVDVAVQGGVRPRGHHRASVREGRKDLGRASPSPSFPVVGGRIGSRKAARGHLRACQVITGRFLPAVPSSSTGRPILGVAFQ